MLEEEEYCRDCQSHPGAFDQGRGIFLYDDRMKYSIMKYKYFGCREYSRFYGKAMYLYGRDLLALWQPQMIVPVPLYWRKQKIRGFNQAELLALEIGKQLGLRVENNWLIRTKNTVPQKLLNGQERRNNLKKAFKAGQNDVKLNAIVIIDDIYTTGSTIDAMAAVCRQQGVSRIYFAALSIGNGQEVR